MTNLGPNTLSQVEIDDAISRGMGVALIPTLPLGILFRETQEAAEQSLATEYKDMNKICPISIVPVSELVATQEDLVEPKLADMLSTLFDSMGMGDILESNDSEGDDTDEDA